jgi:hypothetical protein
MLRILLLFTLLFQTIDAQETYSFIGITGGVQSLSLETASTLSDPKDMTSIGIQYGMQSQEYRTTFSYEYASDFQSIDMSVDYIFMQEMFGTAKVRPYFGATLGYMKYSKDSIADESESYYGFDTGFLFYLTDNIDLDIGYHYYFMERLEPLDTMGGFTVSLHYFY